MYSLIINSSNCSFSTPPVIFLVISLTNTNIRATSRLIFSWISSSDISLGGVVAGGAVGECGGSGGGIGDCGNVMGET